MLDRPENLHFTGPILPPHLNDVEVPAWLQTLDPSKPVIFVKQGTLANFGFDQLVNPALEALENDYVQVIVTAGGIRAAAHTMVETYLPYEFVLPKTSVFITNGGYNGVQHALSYGVPVMSAGISEDKRQVAARINWSGAGIGLLTASSTGAQIHEAVSDILRDPHYRNRARALGESLKKTDALTTIASIRSTPDFLALSESGSVLNGYSESRSFTAWYYTTRISPRHLARPPNHRTSSEDPCRLHPYPETYEWRSFRHCGWA